MIFSDWGVGLWFKVIIECVKIVVGMNIGICMGFLGFFKSCFFFEDGKIF